MQRYLISENGQSKGPYTISQLRSMWRSGALTGDTLYCEEGFDVWLHLRVLENQLEERHESPAPKSTVVARSSKNRGIYIILGILFGPLGFHNFYAGYLKAGFWQFFLTLIMVIFTGGLGVVISWLWALLDVCTVTSDGDGRKMT